MAIFDFLTKSKEQREQDKKDKIQSDDKYSLYDTYQREGQARSNKIRLERAGQTAKIKESKEGYQLWFKVS